MPQQVQTSVENNFTKGLITEATGLNFPENAATAASNCVFTLIGDVTRREGINFEANGTTTQINRANQAMSTYVWNNPGGDGNSKLLVKQVGQTLYFYDIATATVASPLSANLLSLNVILGVGTGSTFDATKECEYADGNGYLFVYHPSCDPQYVTYNPVTLVPAIQSISLQIRDFQGVKDNLGVSVRPTTLSTEHNYNIQNQGWTSGNSVFTSSQSSVFSGGGSRTFSVGSGLSFTNGEIVSCSSYINWYYDNGNGNKQYQATSYCTLTGTVTSYSGTTLVLNVYGVSLTGSTSPGGSISNNYGGNGVTFIQIAPNYFLIEFPWSISSVNTSTITTWLSDEGNYPSNADVWWYFKDDTGTFNPSTTQPSVSLATGNAPQGHFLLPAFNMDRTAASGITGITVVSTTSRPSTGCWFQGRVWYTGVNGQFPATGDAQYYTWTENIYFSQIVQTASDFSTCYQTNDPTSENLNSLLPSDGGVITIVGSGTIHKLFPTQNGLLVFANNGVWYITGSQGIGFTADDYTITKVSSVKILSSKSFIDVLGLPYFWNEDGIYQVMVTQTGSLAVEPLTVGTILTYYNNIPLASKKYARGDYDPINYIIEWAYRSTQESSVTDRYQMDTILVYNTYNKAFYPYNISTGSSTQYIHGVNYVSYPYISTVTPDPTLKYHCSDLVSSVYNHGFAEEYDTSYLDWASANYTSSFTTGYKLHGQGMKRFQLPYVYVFSRNDGYAAYYIQSCWDYAITPEESKWSTAQFTEINDSNSSMIIRRHRLRGSGRAVQLQFSSLQGQPFDLMGWALYENVDTGV